MNNKRFLLIFVIFVMLPLMAFAEVRIETPFSMALSYSEVPCDSHKSYTVLYPYAGTGPVRVSYTFLDDREKSGWSLLCGGSAFVYPMQTLNGSFSALYNICNFDNGGSIVLANTIDAGLVSHFYSYYDVNAGSRKFTADMGVDLEYSLDCYYKFKSNFYIGGGPSVAAAYIDKSFYFVYGFNMTCGFIIN